MNASPSLTASNQEDYELKFGLLEDVVTVIDMEQRYVTSISWFMPEEKQGQASGPPEEILKFAETW